MSCLRRGMLTGVLLAAMTGLTVSADLPDRDEYAYGFPLDLTADAEFFAVDIPLEVYRSVTDPGLRDAGVYNADAQPVPRKIEQAVTAQFSIEQKIPLGLVPLYGQQEYQSDQLRLLLLKDDNGLTLDMKAGESGSQVGLAQDLENPPTSYLVDFRQLEHAVEALEFEWNEMPQGFIGTVYLEDSDDLQHWRKLDSSVLAELRHEETLIEHRRVNLPRKVSEYLRISWQGLSPEWRLQTVTGIYREPDAPATREWLSVDPAPPGKNNNEYVFDVGGYPPADRVGLLLPSDNVVVRASIFSRRRGTDIWRLATSGLFYNISRQGKAFQSPAVPIQVTRNDEWKVFIDSGATTGPVRLWLGWRPDSLVFVAQGPQPYELVTGRARDALERYPQEAILGDSAVFSLLRETGQAGNATLGPRQLIAGSRGLDARPRLNWKTVLLWAGLSGAILLVGRMAFVLLRDLKQN